MATETDPDWIVHGKWLADRGLDRVNLAPMGETIYTGFVAAALLGADSVRVAVLAALLPQTAELRNAELEYLFTPGLGLDLILLLRLAAAGDAQRAAVLIEHKRWRSPANFPALATYTRRAPGHAKCVHDAKAQRRGSDPPPPGIAQLDAAVCFDDWHDDATEGATVAARILLDARGRSPNTAFKSKLTHPEAWQTTSYETFGGSLRHAYDHGEGDTVLRTGLVPLLRALHADK